MERKKTMTKEQIQEKINEIESQYPNLHIDLHRDQYYHGDVNKLCKLYKQLNKKENNMIPNAKLEKMSTMQLNDLVANIESIKKQKLLNELKIGSKVYVVQKTKKTPGVITKIMQSKCLVDLSGKIYRVSMSMLELDA